MLDHIVEDNLKLMEDCSKGGMGYLYMRESRGGNAGYYKGKPCMALNFRFDKNTGRIAYFANYQNVPKKYFLEPFSKGTFRIAITAKFGRIFYRGGRKIVNVYLNDASKEAKKIINLTVRLYNQIHKPKIRIIRKHINLK